MSWPTYSFASDSAASFTGNPPAAMRLTQVRRAVTLISQDLARIPIRAHRKANGEAVEYSDSRVDLLNDDWNEYHTAFEAKRWLFSQALLWGNSFAVISRRGSTVDSLIPMDPWNVSLNKSASGLPVYQTSEYGEVGCEDILHFRMLPTRRQMWGTSPVSDAVRSLQLAAMLETAGVEQFKMPGLGKLVLQTEEVLGASTIRSIQEAWKSAHSGSDGMLRPIVAQGGAKVEQVGRSLVDQDWANARKQAIEDVARAFGVPPFVLFSDTQAFTQEHARLYADSLLGYTVGFAAEMRRKLFPGEQVRLSFDTTAIQRGSFNEAMSGYQIAVQLGVMTPNEVRKEMGLPPVEGGDDMYVGPNMMQGSSEPEDAEQDLPPDDDGDAAAEE